MGAAGRRRGWNSIIAVPIEPKSLVISIFDGKITNFIETEDKRNESTVIYSNELIHDSPELIFLKS